MQYQMEASSWAVRVRNDGVCYFVEQVAHLKLVTIFETGFSTTATLGDVRWAVSFTIKPTVFAILECATFVISEKWRSVNPTEVDVRKEEL